MEHIHAHMCIHRQLSTPPGSLTALGVSLDPIFFLHTPNPFPPSMRQTVGPCGLYKFKVFIKASDHRQKATRRNLWHITRDLSRVSDPSSRCTITLNPQWHGFPHRKYLGRPHLCSHGCPFSHCWPHLGLGAIHIVALDVTVTGVDIGRNRSALGGSTLGQQRRGTEKSCPSCRINGCASQVGLVLPPGSGQVGGPGTNQLKAVGFYPALGRAIKECKL